MKLKNNHLILFLFFIIVLVAVLFYFNRKKEKGVFPDKVLSITAKEIVSLEITPSFDTDKKFRVYKKNNKWFVSSGSRTLEADTTFVNSALAEIEKIRPDRLVTRDQSLWKEYGVDSSGTLLIIHLKNDKTLSVVIGNMTFQDDIYVSSYIRLTNQNEVFASECYLEGTIKKDIMGWVRKTKKEGLQ